MPALIPPQTESARVESRQQPRIIDCNLEAGLARTAVSLPESKRNLLHRSDVTAHQHLKQHFEARPLNGPRHPYCCGAGGAERQEEPAVDEGSRGRRWAGGEIDLRRIPGADAGYRPARSRRGAGEDQARAQRSGMDRARVRLESGETREVERY